MDTLGSTGFSLCLEVLDFFAQAEACATQGICAKVAQALDGAEKLSGRTAPYGRGSVCRCKHLVPILSRDHRERFFQHRLQPVLYYALLLACHSKVVGPIPSDVSVISFP